MLGGAHAAWMQSRMPMRASVLHNMRVYLYIDFFFLKEESPSKCLSVLVRERVHGGDCKSNEGKSVCGEC